ncbi:MAG: HlyD family efflux transporter periplasmic adaptor subunit [Planctomycetes bacterium]|nr:HlyD family efflux transporter periplasmic adaptor subunit [Planctomycetota bacterium]MBM4080209.1 HlyD family efflux transporter periplasmic adaptor subunit [Planctomycetota bacterium]MBM4084706.1 HlyD family efflux transporter periplasmic adaptor subunit [Planctomycetota bacterium]
MCQSDQRWRSAALLACALILGCPRGRPTDTMLLSGTVEMDTVDVGSLTGGRIAAVEAQEGDPVKAGQALVRFEDERAKAELAEAEAAVRELSSTLEKLHRGSRQEEIDRAKAEVGRAQARLDMLRAGARQQELDSAKAEYLAAKSNREDAENELRRSEQLFKDGTISVEAIDRARNRRENAAQTEAARKARWDLLQAGSRVEEVTMAQNDLAAAKANLALAEQGPRKEDIAVAQAAVEGAKARLRKAEEQMRETTVKSPIDGMVQSLDLYPGDLVSGGHPVARLLRKGTARVIVFVPENRMGHVRVGQTAEVRTDSFPDQKLVGRVRRISEEAEFTPRNVQTPEERAGLVFAVRVDIEDPAGILRAGMSADVVFASH